MMENREWPLVTVFTLVYNTGQYVVEALESVQANNYPNLQHIIIDDCSTDGKSVQQVQQWIDGHNYPCMFIKHEQNQGICKSLNEILRLAKGKYIFPVSDDLILPQKIKIQVEALEASSDKVALVYSDVYLIDSQGSAYPKTYLENFGYSYESAPQGDCLKEIFVQNFIPANGVMIKLDCFKHVGYFDESLYYEDWDMNIRILRHYEILKSPYISAKYRQHTTSVVRSKKFEYFDTSLKVEFRNLGISKEIDSMIKKRMADDVEYYYAAGGPRSTHWLFKVFVLTFNVKVLIFFTASLLRIQYDSLRKLTSGKSE